MRGHWARLPHTTATAIGVSALLLVLACGPAPAPPGDRAPAAASAAPVASSPVSSPASSPPESPAPLQPVHGSYSGIQVVQAPAWFALEGGYFREQGLDVELMNITSTSPVIQAMLANEVQLGGIDAGASILATLSGAEVALLIAGSNHSVFSIISQPAIEEPAQLRGKVMGITRLGSATHSAGLLALDLWGLEPDRDVAFRQLNQVSAIFAALEAHQVDAGVLSLPSTSLARRAGYHELINLATQGPEYPSIVVSGLRSWVNGHEEAMRRFTRGFVQGVHRGRTDKAWAEDVYRKYVEIDDPQVLDEMYAEFERCCPRVPYVSEEGIARLLGDLAQDEPRLVGKQPGDFIDARFLRELEASGFINQVMGDAP
jgi:NitT/TauT family transport system substrate-binding protein